MTSEFSESEAPFTVWSVLDSRPGHRNQVRGLLEALAELVQPKTPAELPF